MASLFKSKRITSDPKSSASSTKSGKEPDSSKSQRNSGSSSASKSGIGSAAGGATTHSKAPNHSSKAGKGTERSHSVPDVPVWADEDCPPGVDSRFSASTVNDKALSISRSGRYKAKGKVRASLFSDGSVDGTEFQDGEKRGTTRASSSSHGDRPTVLHASGRPAAEPSSGRSPLSNHVKKTDAASPSWSVTPNSVNL